jgi:hypothetical protein
MSDLVRLSSALCLAFTAACATPDERLNDFNDRVIDANTDRVDAEVLTTIPDVSGRFLFALDPAPTPGSYFPFLATVELIDGTTDEPKISVVLQPLTVNGRDEVGDPINTVTSPVPVALTGEFTLEYDDALIPAQTNASSGTEIMADMVLDGIIRSEDEFCGLANGMVVSPFTLSLNNSTFGTVRLADGQSPADVEISGRCPADSTPDAGVPDAMPAGDGGN